MGDGGPLLLCGGPSAWSYSVLRCLWGFQGSEIFRDIARGGARKRTRRFGATCLVSSRPRMRMHLQRRPRHIENTTDVSPYPEHSPPLNLRGRQGVENPLSYSVSEGRPLNLGGENSPPKLKGQDVEPPCFAVFFQGMAPKCRGEDSQPLFHFSLTLTLFNHSELGYGVWVFIWV